MPRRPENYTVVIPTRNRQTYCAQAILSVLLAQREDVEIIVVDNSDDPNLLPELLNKLDLSKFVTLIESEDEPLRMDHNWERAIPHIKTEWVSFIGDDDGFKIDAFDQLDYLTQNIEADAFTWGNINYKWPCFPGEEASLLNIKFAPATLSRVPTELLLEHHRTWTTDEKWPLAGPTVYHGLVRKSIIDKVVAEHGRYFIDHTVDYASGIVNCRYTSHMVYYSSPVTIMGASGNSNTAMLNAPVKRKTVREHLAELGGPAPTFTEFLESRLIVPVVESGFRNTLRQMDLTFETTADKFIISCLRELSVIYDWRIFQEEIARLHALAAKHGASETVKQQISRLPFNARTRTTGRLGDSQIISFDTAQFGWSGVVDVASKYSALHLPFAQDRRHHWSLLKNYGNKFNDDRAKAAAAQFGGTQ